MAEAFLAGAADALQALDQAAEVTLYPAVPPPVARVAGVERMQMLIESASRVALQRLLSNGLPELHALRARHRVLRWAVDVDPLAI